MLLTPASPRARVAHSGDWDMPWRLVLGQLSREQRYSQHVPYGITRFSVPDHEERDVEEPYAEGELNDLVGVF